VAAAAEPMRPRAANVAGSGTGTRRCRHRRRRAAAEATAARRGTIHDHRQRRRRCFRRRDCRNHPAGTRSSFRHHHHHSPRSSCSKRPTRPRHPGFGRENLRCSEPPPLSCPPPRPTTFFFDSFPLGRSKRTCPLSLHQSGSALQRQARHCVLHVLSRFTLASSELRGIALTASSPSSSSSSSWSSRSRKKVSNVDMHVGWFCVGLKVRKRARHVLSKR
jgi:hypothetical protein